MTAAEELGAVSVGGDARQTEHLGTMVDWPQRVTVPDIRFTLESHLMEQVVTRFNPLSGSRESHGIELITGLIHFMDTINH